MPSDTQTGDIHRDCMALIRETRVMTLSTCRPRAWDSARAISDGKTDQACIESTAWAAPVYYVFRDNTFYFFSNPRSRHILDGEDRDGAGALFRDADHAEQLRGIQMSGTIQASPRGKDAVAAAFAYCVRFGITPGKDSHIIDFFNTRFHAQLYRFNPKRIWYMDNRRGMGNRTQIRL